jgi:hypothetical protein
VLVEQAFYNLPEILVGSGYAKQEYEAGIVSAFSLALLQELNGRNVPNPISSITAEKRFGSEIKKLRADLHVRLERLYVGSRVYSEFGFRHSNWIEAKFFRAGKGTPPSTQNLGSVVADIIRLVALVPIERAKKKQDNDPDISVTGRYFLHVYYGDPLAHLNPNRKSPKEGQAAQRSWVQQLLSVGESEINDFELADETDTFFTHLGSGLRTATCSIRTTNFKIAPRDPAQEKFYTFLLTRIDEGSLSFEDRTFHFMSNRTWECDPPNSFEQLRQAVASRIKPKRQTKTTSASESDTGDDEDNEEEVADAQNQGQ